jgi:hypothetical protein
MDQRVRMMHDWLQTIKKKRDEFIYIKNVHVIGNLSNNKIFKNINLREEQFMTINNLENFERMKGYNKFEVDKLTDYEKWKEEKFRMFDLNLNIIRNIDEI